MNVEQIDKKYIIGGLAAVILILVGLIFFVGNGAKLFESLFPSPTPTATPTPSPIPTPTPIDGDSVIFTGLRFTPQTLELEIGQVVNIANLGDNTIEIATNDASEEGRKLNLGSIEAGDTSQFVEFREAGVYEYFNTFNPEETGRIIVR